MTTSTQKPKKKGNPDNLKHFIKGQSGNPAGRPKGKTLKEYTRDMLASMTYEERENFLHGIPKEMIWKMAEGNPDQQNALTGPNNESLFTEEQKKRSKEAISSYILGRKRK